MFLFIGTTYTKAKVEAILTVIFAHSSNLININSFALMKYFIALINWTVDIFEKFILINMISECTLIVNITNFKYQYLLLILVSIKKLVLLLLKYLNFIEFLLLIHYKMSGSYSGLNYIKINNFYPYIYYTEISNEYNAIIYICYVVNL